MEALPKKIKRFAEDQGNLLIILSVILSLIIFSFFSIATSAGEGGTLNRVSTQVLSVRLADAEIETYAVQPVPVKKSAAESSTEVINP